MKKTYINPVTKNIVLNTHPLLQASQGGVGDGAGLGKGYDPEAVTYSRRGGSLWDEDEE